MLYESDRTAGKQNCSRIGGALGQVCLLANSISFGENPTQEFNAAIKHGTCSTTRIGNGTNHNGKWGKI